MKEIKNMNTDGINEIELGEHRLYVVKHGEKQQINVKTSNGLTPYWVWIPTSARLQRVPYRVSRMLYK